MLNVLDELTRESLAIRVRSTPPTAQLGRGTFNALTFELDRSPGAGQVIMPTLNMVIIAIAADRLIGARVERRKREPGLRSAGAA